MAICCLNTPLYYKTSYKFPNHVFYIYLGCFQYEHYSNLLPFACIYLYSGSDLSAMMNLCLVVMCVIGIVQGLPVKQNVEDAQLLKKMLGVLEDLVVGDLLFYSALGHLLYKLYKPWRWNICFICYKSHGVCHLLY